MACEPGTFNKDDYESGDGMLTSVWGPSLWHSIHTMSFNYPVKLSTPAVKLCKGPAKLSTPAVKWGKARCQV